MSERGKVVITDFLSDGLAPERDGLGDLAEVVALNAHREEELVDQIDNADALMVYHNIAITDRSIARLDGCKLIVRCGVGVDNIDVQAARRLGIPVANVPDYGTEEVADSALAMALSLARGVHQLNSRLRRNEGAWRYTQAAPLQRLRGSVFGIVGLGRIGTAVARRAKAIGMDVVFHDPYKPVGYDKALGIRQAASLQELLRQSTIVTLHCPLTDETQHLINAETLSMMQPRSFLINTARGCVADTTAVVEAIASGQLAGAGLDVLPQEPPADEDPLIVAWRDPTHPAHDRLLINPHAAFYCEQGLADIRVKATQECRRALLREPLRNVVN